MRPPRDDASKFLSGISRHLIGDEIRNFHCVADKLAIPYETFRRRMLKLNHDGITILPSLIPEHLGLERVRAFFDFSYDVKEPNKLLESLHEHAGLFYYARSMNNYLYDVEFLVPSDCYRQLSNVLSILQSKDIIGHLSLGKIAWKQQLGMKTEYYDYQNSTWDIDFSKIRPSLSESEMPRPNSETNYDHIDLLIVKNIQHNPWIKTIEMANKIGVSDRDVAYHLNNHVFGRNQVSGFVLKWVGPSEAWSKHGIVPFTFVFDGLKQNVMRHAMSVMTSVPFSWNHFELRNEREQKEKGVRYIAETLIPVSFLMETMKYISDHFRAMHLAPEILQVDPACFKNYTIPYFLHLPTGEWKFSEDKIMDNLLATIKESGAH